MLTYECIQNITSALTRSCRSSSAQHSVSNVHHKISAYKSSPFWYWPATWNKQNNQVIKFITTTSSFIIFCFSSSFIFKCLVWSRHWWSWLFTPFSHLVCWWSWRCLYDLNKADPNNKMYNLLHGIFHNILSGACKKSKTIFMTMVTVDETLDHHLWSQIQNFQYAAGNPDHTNICQMRA